MAWYQLQKKERSILRGIQSLTNHIPFSIIKSPSANGFLVVSVLALRFDAAVLVIKGNTTRVAACHTTAR